ncbi:MAG: right-handed parallel beta-helix repeat-containing protein [Acidobacteria bacterium]|nr:right-handed parallel beta-helix repeat-containing protein [Acidobacteriota bacterium]
MRRATLLLLFAVAAQAATEREVRAALEARTGSVTLPAGVIEIASEIVLPEGVRDLAISGDAAGTTLRAAAGFRGRAILVARKARGLRVSALAFDGNRAALEVRAGLPAYDTPFARFTANNGILVEEGEGVAIENASFSSISGFAVLVARSTGVRIRKVNVTGSGSRNAAGRNNTTGGILFEEGSGDFQATDCVFRRIRGNGVWTHSLYTSPRNRDGLIARNRFEEIGRDAIQVGHATRVRVEENTGRRIGFPADVVDTEGGGTPVAIDTAGNVDLGVYARNRFDQISGKCIDLDGFHHGEVLGNTCVSGDFGIVMNNTNPDMQSEHIVVKDNEMRGMKYGGIFVIGTDHVIEGNRLLDLNTAHCDDCAHFPGEPALLRSGIYLGQRAERPAVARRNVIRGNTITGYKMNLRCLGAAPGVILKENRLENNLCQ